jgi:hypothetical protein
MITLKELNPHDYPTTEEVESNLKDLLDKMNKVRSIYGKPMTVTSGLRSQADQERINPSAPKSKHLLGQACDVADTDGALMNWVLDHLDLMKDIGLYFEHFGYTHPEGKGWWVHFQSVPPASGKRIFVPSSAPNPNPSIWDGQYQE